MFLKIIIKYVFVYGNLGFSFWVLVLYFFISLFLICVIREIYLGNCRLSEK